MNRAGALALVAALAVATGLAFVLGLPYLVVTTIAALVAMPRRRAFLGFAAVALAVNVAILAIAVPGGALVGLVGGMRLVCVLAVNLAVLGRVGAARLIEALRPPPRATGVLAAILLAASDVGRDFARLRDARRLEGAWPRAPLARAREAARLLPPLLLAAHRRALVRREALLLAGHPVAPWFVPFVAVAALVAAGRLAFLALPNVALSYVVAFLGGVLFGPLVAAAGAFAGMALTDLLLTGLYPGGFVNAPAMALLALLGGALRAYPFDGASRAHRVAGAAMAAAVGVLGTFAFSLASDALTWLLLYAARPEALAPMILAGLAFNVIPALANGALFALSVGPTVRAFRVARARAPPAPSTTGAASPAAAEPTAPA